MRRGWIEPPSARPVALCLTAFLSLRAALIRHGVSLTCEPRHQFGRDACAISFVSCIGWVLKGRGPVRSDTGLVAFWPRRCGAAIPSSEAPRAGAVVPPGRCPEASREWVVTPPAGAAPAPPTAYLRMAAPRGRGRVRIGTGCEGRDKFWRRARSIGDSRLKPQRSQCPA